MTHLHMPDGVLPPWLWITAWIISILWVWLVSHFAVKRPTVMRRLPLLAVVSALMLVAMSIEIVPLAYHVNLSILAGILLGPLLAPIAAFIVELFLALLGHGGISVIGVNFLLLSIEMIAASLIFRGVFALLRRLLRNTEGRVEGIAAAVTAVVALAISTTLMFVVVSTIPGSIPTHEGELLSLKAFATLVYTLGPIGWLLEGALTGLVVAYVARVRPELLSHARRIFMRLRETGDAEGPGGANGEDADS